MPILTASLDLQGSFTVVDQSQVSYDIQFQNLSLKFDVDVEGGPANNAAADSSSVTANYDATFHGSIPIMPNFITGEVKGGTSISVSDFKLSRLWQEDLPELNESDSGDRQTPGVVTIAGTMHLDGIHYTVQPPPGISMPQAGGVTSFNVPFVAQAKYDPGKASQKNDASTSGGNQKLQARGKMEIKRQTRDAGHRHGCDDNCQCHWKYVPPASDPLPCIGSGDAILFCSRKRYGDAQGGR